jgi:type IV fimbrial biogenesis protein FimT
MKTTKGFTLIELMVVLAIIAIVTAISTPNVIRWVNTQRFNSGVRDIHAAIEATRQRAVKENGQGRVSFTANSGEFETFVVRRAIPEANDPDPNIHRLPPGVTISTTWTFVFTSRGTTGRDINGNTTNGTITVTGPGGLSLNIVVNTTGGSRII